MRLSAYQWSPHRRNRPEPTGRRFAARRHLLIDDQRLNQATHRILAAAIEVHRILGPGLLESIYMECVSSN
jgi:hypothetical protein